MPVGEQAQAPGSESRPKSPGERPGCLTAPLQRLEAGKDVPEHRVRDEERVRLQMQAHLGRQALAEQEIHEQQVHQ